MKKLFILIFVLSLNVTGGFSRQQSEWNVSNGALLDGKNIVKVNLTSLALRNFGFYGERIISEKMSVILGVNFMPNGGIPLVGNFTGSITEQDVVGMINNVRVNSFALMPELRLYLSSGYGKGFYLSPYLKYEHFGLGGINVTFKDHNDKNRKFDLTGGLNTYSGGLMIGYQWLIGKNKNFVVDFSILGLHGGGAAGNINAYEQKGGFKEYEADIKQSIDDALKDVPLIKYTTTVEDKNANVEMKGPWAFFRAGLSIGYRF